MISNHSYEVNNCAFGKKALIRILLPIFLVNAIASNFSHIIAVWSPRKPKCQNVTNGCDHQNWYLIDLCRPLTRRHCRSGGNWFKWRHEHLEDIGYAHNTKKKLIFHLFDNVLVGTYLMENILLWQIHIQT